MISDAAIRWTLEVSRRWQLSQEPLTLRTETKLQKYVADVLKNHDSKILEAGQEKDICDLAITVGQLVAEAYPSSCTLEKVKGFYMKNFLEIEREEQDNPLVSKAVNFLKEQVETYAKNYDLSLEEEDLFDLEIEDGDSSVYSDSPPPPPPPYSRFSSSDSFSSRSPPSPFKTVTSTHSLTSSEAVTPQPNSSGAITPIIVNGPLEGGSIKLLVEKNKDEITRAHARLLGHAKEMSPLAQWLQEDTNIQRKSGSGQTFRKSEASSFLSLSNPSSDEEDVLRMSL